MPPRPKHHRKTTRKPEPSMASVNVAAWEDDPGDPNLQPPLQPISFLPPPDNTPPLPFKIKGSQPKPQVYKTGTPEFRYWAAAVALRRTADFWSTIVPARTSWQVGRMLAVDLDSGDDLNAFYTRGGGGEPRACTSSMKWSKNARSFLAKAPTWFATKWGTRC